MTETIIINNPSPELLKFIDEQQERKRRQMDEIREKYLKELKINKINN